MTGLKTCSKCGEVKPATSEFFGLRKQVKCGLEARCLDCSRKEDRARYRANPEPKKDRAARWNRDHPEVAKARRQKPGAQDRQRAYNTARRHEKADVLRDYKLARGCAVCGYDEHYEALDFHHRDTATKEIAMYHWQNYPWPRVMAELEKCVVLCATCHRLFHAGLVELPGKFYHFDKITG